MKLSIAAIATLAVATAQSSLNQTAGLAALNFRQRVVPAVASQSLDEMRSASNDMDITGSLNDMMSVSNDMNINNLNINDLNINDLGSECSPTNSPYAAQDSNRLFPQAQRFGVRQNFDQQLGALPVTPTFGMPATNAQQTMPVDSANDAVFWAEPMDQVLDAAMDIPSSNASPMPSVEDCDTDVRSTIPMTDGLTMDPIFNGHPLPLPPTDDDCTVAPMLDVYSMPADPMMNQWPAMGEEETPRPSDAPSSSPQTPRGKGKRAPKPSKHPDRSATPKRIPIDSDDEESVTIDKDSYNFAPTTGGGNDYRAPRVNQTLMNITGRAYGGGRNTFTKGRTLGSSAAAASTTIALIATALTAIFFV